MTRKIQDRIKDFEGLINTVQDSVPYPAVRKLYKLTKDLTEEVNRLESELATCKATVSKPTDTSPISVDVGSAYADQIREMTEEIEQLKKEAAELKSDKWYTPLWNK